MNKPVDWNLISSKIILLFQLCGFCSPQLQLSASKNVRLTLTDILSNLWLLLQLIFAAFITVFAYYRYFLFDFKGKLEKLNGVLKFSAILLSYTVILIECLLRKKRLRDIVWYFRFVDDSLKGPIQFYESSLRKNQKKICLKIIFLLLVTSLFEIAVASTILRCKCFAFIWSVSIVPLTMGRIRHLQYIFYVDQLTSRFEIIKTELILLGKFSRSVATNDEIISQKLYSKLDCIKKCYSVLWETSLSINATFGFSQVTNMLQSFIQLTCDFYLIYALMYANKSTHHIRGEGFLLK